MLHHIRNSCRRRGYSWGRGFWDYKRQFRRVFAAFSLNGLLWRFLLLWEGVHRVATWFRAWFRLCAGESLSSCLSPYCCWPGPFVSSLSLLSVSFHLSFSFCGYVRFFWPYLRLSACIFVSQLCWLGRLLSYDLPPFICLAALLSDVWCPGLLAIFVFVFGFRFFICICVPVWGVSSQILMIFIFHFAFVFRFRFCCPGLRSFLSPAFVLRSLHTSFLSLYLSPHVCLPVAGRMRTIVFPQNVSLGFWLVWICLLACRFAVTGACQVTPCLFPVFPCWPVYLLFLASWCLHYARRHWKIHAFSGHSVRRQDWYICLPALFF